MLIGSVVAAIEKCKEMWSPLNDDDGKTFHPEGTHDIEDIESNSVFTFVGFHGREEFRIPSDCENPFDWDGFMKDDPNSEWAYWEESDNLLCHHPLVLHSFASFPPLREMIIGYGEDIEVINELGEFPPIPPELNDAHEGITVKRIVENILNQ